MTGGMAKVTQLLCKVVIKWNDCNGQKENKVLEKDIQSYHVDSTERSKLNKAIQSCVEGSITEDQHEKGEDISNKSSEDKETECTKKCRHASVSNNQ